MKRKRFYKRATQNYRRYVNRKRKRGVHSFRLRPFSVSRFK